MAMTPNQRRAKDAERKRRKRAEAAAEREANIRDARTGDESRASREMRTSVEDSLSHMSWLRSSDNASVTQARALARVIDEMEHAGEITKALSAHRALSKVLYDLGGTPVVRMQRELRASRVAAPKPNDEGVKGGSGKGSTTGGIVTQFQRPSPRVG